ncbi:enoyl-CoA hydratase [Nereida sp. MMG025]|uniref:enoyl-CoA hydratase n=1 Tax=Nereida sp. MMG025 TaxID=2909981 RepID=UPI001F02684D|nr:enoyl-CoA hydratase [Nereida sp. MMG025]MCF6443238.1 enoyl-CoA hydratase [Nereida sp. MMG025]
MALLERSDAHGVATITLNTPETLNALSLDMIAAVHGMFDTIAADEAIRVTVLKGAGKAFCAGHNLREMQTMRQSPDKGATALKGLFDACAAMMQRIPTLPQPVIAQTHGIATAAGCQLVASCDLAVSAQDCRFGVNGVNIGLFCSTPMVALSRNIPRKQAFEMLTTGDFIHADRALDLGLVNRIVPAADLEAETQALAQQIAGKLGSAVRIGKRAFYDQLQMPLDAAYAYTGDVMLENMANDDTAEGIAAFIEKRAPDWG